MIPASTSADGNGYVTVATAPAASIEDGYLNVVAADNDPEYLTVATGSSSTPADGNGYTTVATASATGIGDGYSRVVTADNKPEYLAVAVATGSALAGATDDGAYQEVSPQVAAPYTDVLPNSSTYEEMTPQVAATYANMSPNSSAYEEVSPQVAAAAYAEVPSDSGMYQELGLGSTPAHPSNGVYDTLSPRPDTKHADVPSSIGGYEEAVPRPATVYAQMPTGDSAYKETLTNPALVYAEVPSSGGAYQELLPRPTEHARPYDRLGDGLGQHGSSYGLLDPVYQEVPAAQVSDRARDEARDEMPDGECSEAGAEETAWGWGSIEDCSI